MKDVPSECRNGSMNYWLTFKSYFLLQDDKCHAYYEHVLIDPMVKVPPTKVNNKWGWGYGHTTDREQNYLAPDKRTIQTSNFYFPENMLLVLIRRASLRHF